MYLLLLVVPVYLGGCWFLAKILTDAYQEPVVYQNYFPEDTVLEWSLITKDNQKIAAWYIKKDTTKVVILLAGKGGNRLSMLNKASFYLDKNYSVVLPDLRGTGDSKAGYVTLGYKERFDLLACVDTLQKLHYSQIAAHGHSLGAATIAYSCKEFSGYNFVVLESCYDNIDNAFKHRMQRIHLPILLATPVKWFAEKRLEIETEQLYPEKYMAHIKCPALFLCGDNEWQIPLSESRKLFDKCAAAKKYIHVFKDAQHQDFMYYNEREYKEALEEVIN